MHKKCLNKLQEILGCACVGDMLAELEKNGTTQTCKKRVSADRRPHSLREKLENEFGEWLCRQGLSVPDEKCDQFIDRCLEIIKEK